jgi:Cof subfamily protein (haloacid dehalogenase superfamily)
VVKGYVFLDFDGTLRTDDKRITDRTKAVLREIEKHGWSPVVCSGREKDVVAKIRQEIGAGRYVIFNNGAGIYDCEKWKVLHYNPINPKSVHALCDIALQYRDIYFSFPPPFATQVNIQTHDKDVMKKMKEQIDAVPNVKIVNTHKGMFGGDYAKTEEFSTRFYYDVCDEHTNKGYAVKKFCEIIGIDPKNCIAMGDSVNDISMLQSVGRGVAMGNAVPELKAVATEVTETNNNEGVAVFLEKLIGGIK